MNSKYLTIAFLLLVTLIFNGCDDPEIVNPQEVITTVNFTLTSSSGESLTLSFQDLDGDGGGEPIIEGATLDANETYTGTLEFLNESITPIEDITAEVLEQDEEHQVFFQTEIAGITFDYNDQDEDGNPLGLNMTITTGAAGSGLLSVILRHEPNKFADGASDGDSDIAGGETDIDADFPIIVQ